MRRLTRRALVGTAAVLIIGSLVGTVYEARSPNRDLDATPRASLGPCWTTVTSADPSFSLVLRSGHGTSGSSPAHTNSASIPDTSFKADVWWNSVPAKHRLGFVGSRA